MENNNMKSFFKRFTHPYEDETTDFTFLDPHLETKNPKFDSKSKILEVKKEDDFTAKSPFKGFHPFYDKFQDSGDDQQSYYNEEDYNFTSFNNKIDNVDDELLKLDISIDDDFEPTVSIVRSSYNNPETLLDVSVSDELPVNKEVNPFKKSSDYLDINVDDPLPDPVEVFKDVDFNSNINEKSVIENGIEIFENENFEYKEPNKPNDLDTISKEYTELLQNKNSNLYHSVDRKSSDDAPLTGIERFKSSNNNKSTMRERSNDFTKDQNRVWTEFDNELGKLL